MIEKTERIMLLQLEFHTNIPTPIDFLQLLLQIYNKDFDFSEIILECLNYSYVSLIGNELILIKNRRSLMLIETIYNSSS